MPESFDFRSWVSQQKGPYTLDDHDRDHLRIETDYGLSEVNFYNIDPEPEVVELRITCKKTNTTKFFLHFQAIEEEHSKDLFNEMIDSLLALKDVQTTKVLLCCTAGMTTTFFAEKMNEVSRVLELDYVFNAVSVNEVYENVKDYECVLVAPQVGYMEKDLRNRIIDKPVLRIPTNVFASYDANACIEFVREELTKFRAEQKRKKKEAECCSACHSKHDYKILCISSAPSSTETRIQYRIYDHGKCTLDREVVKKYLDINDIDDIIDIQYCQNTGTPFDAISIAVPGIVQNGTLDLPRSHGNRLYGPEREKFDIEAYFKECVDVPVIIENNANCAALGWYSNQDKYQNICLMTQPNGWMIGGQGIIVNGRMIRGAHGIAGEIKHIVNHIQWENPLNLNPYHLDSIKQVVSKAILMNVSILDPEVVCIRCEMLPDMDEIREELKKYLPEERIPDLVHIDNFNECVLMGQEILCINYLKQQKGKKEDE